MIEITGVAMREGPAPGSSSKYYPSEELSNKAGDLTGTPVFWQSNRTVEATIGKVTSAEYADGEVRFTADIAETHIAEQIQSGEADVRALGRHSKDLSKDEDGNRVVSGLTLLGLSVAPIETGIEAAQLASTRERTPPPTATMDAYNDDSVPFALAADIDKTMTETITVDESTYSQLTEIRSSSGDFDDETPLNDVIAYCAAEAGAPTDEQIREEQARLHKRHGRDGSPDGESEDERLSDDEQRTVKSEQERLRRKMFDN